MGRFPEAIPHAEVRGWIRDIPGNPDDNEEEFNFNLIPDVGWTTNATGVVPINTPALLNSTHLANPYNILQFGGRYVDGSGHAFGGPNQVVLHIETDSWGPKRGCWDMDSRTPEPPPMDPTWGPTSTNIPCGYYYVSFRPPSWTTATATYNPLYPNYWPLPIFSAPVLNAPARPYRAGDYVRIVGTLWMDGLHYHTAGSNDDAKHCWDQGNTWGWGWMEMHPVWMVPGAASPERRTAHVALAASLARIAS